ncbi:MAG TPA: hypothetical protein VGD40_13940 [Chryseosolibacter sp.]
MKFYLILFCFVAGSAVAQVPGYMGKRLSIFLEGNPTPALFVQNSNNAVIADPGGDGANAAKVNRFAFNFRPQASIEYLVHRDVSLGVSYSRISIGTARAYTVDPTHEEQHVFSLNHDVVKGQAAGLHLKIFQFKKSASLAPIGFYQGFSVYVTQTNTYDTKKSKAKQFKNDFLYPVAAFTFGRQSMIAKNLLLKTGAEFGWAFVPFNFMTETIDDWNVQEYSGYNVHRSLFGSYLFNLNVAVGYTF